MADPVLETHIAEAITYIPENKKRMLEGRIEYLEAKTDEDRLLVRSDYPDLIGKFNYLDFLAGRETE